MFTIVLKKTEMFLLLRARNKSSSFKPFSPIHKLNTLFKR